MSETPAVPPEPSASTAHERLETGASAASRFKLGVRQCTKWVLLVCAVLMLVVGVAWALLLTQILPRIDMWRTDVAQQATRALGVTVRVGELEGHAEGIWPVVRIKQLALLDAQGRVALLLPEVEGRMALSTLSPQALWAGEIRLARLTLKRPNLDVRRDRAGVWHVAGLPVPSNHDAQASSAGADWLLTQSRIEIQDGHVTWTDELKGRSSLSLDQVHLTLTHALGLGQRHHRLHARAVLPESMGEHVEVRGQLSHPLWHLDAAQTGWRKWWPQLTRASDWRQWQGGVTLDLPHVNLAAWQANLDLPVHLQSGQGRVQWHTQIEQGRVSGAQARLALSNVHLRLAPDLSPLILRHLAADVSVQQHPTQTQLSVKGLSFTLDDGLVWPHSAFALAWHHDADPQISLSEAWARTQGGHARAEHLDLALLAAIADRLPLPAPYRQTLAKYAPQGVISDLNWDWQGHVASPSAYHIKAAVNNLVLREAELGKRPGLAGANVQIDATEQGGKAKLSMQSGWLSFPGVFEEPRIPMSALSANVAWQKGRGPQDWQVTVSDAQFANADATGHLNAVWQLGLKADAAGHDQPIPLPGRLMLSGELTQAQATRVWRYLPLAVPKGTRDYVKHAFHSGRGERVAFEVDGDLRHFPFKDDEGGRFRVHVPIHDAEMSYVPPEILGLSPQAQTGIWPRFTGLEGQLIFEGRRMRIEQAKAALGTMGSGRFALSNVRGVIDDMGAHSPHLRIQGEGAGPLNDLLKFLVTSPIGAWTGGALNHASGEGRGAMTLSLDIPLNDAAHTQVKSKVTLKESDQATLRLGPSIPAFQAMRGTIDITDADLSVQVRTRVWGQETVVQGARDAQGILRFEGRGHVDADGLRQAREYHGLPQLAQHLRGRSPMQVQVAIGEQTEVTVTSTLEGMALDLPSPMNKDAALAWPLSVKYRTTSVGRDAIGVDLSNTATHPAVHVDMRRDVSGSQAQIQQGLVHIEQVPAGQAPKWSTMPVKGWGVHWRTNTIPADDWLKLAETFNTSADIRSSAGAAHDWLPNYVDLQTRAFMFKQRNLSDVKVNATRGDAGVWRANLEAQQAAGRVEWRPATVDGASHDRLVARFSRLSVPKAAAQLWQSRAAEQLLSAETSKALPALDIQIEDFDWQDLDLGRVHVQAVNQVAHVAGRGAVSQWHLQKFMLMTPEATLNATGQWAPNPDGTRAKSDFDFDLEMSSSGDLLTRLGLPKTIRGGKGRMQGQVSWLGSPLEPNPETMSGHLRIDIQQGQFLKVEPGAAKLLGVLSLQSLPRRLSLDFRDLFQQGFAFDAIDGDVQVDHGVASTRNLRMRGVPAVVLMEGQADLQQETQHLHVYVVPHINAEAASLAYAAINPVVGLGTFLAQYLLRKQVAEANTQEFTVKGSWSEPHVERVLREEPEAQVEITAPQTPS